VIVLDRTPDFAPALPTLIPAAAALASLGAVALRLGLRARAAMAVAAAAATLALAAGPATYSAATVGRSLADNNMLAGPASAGAGFGGGRGRFGGPPSGFGSPGGASAGGNDLPAGPPPGGASSSGRGALAGGGPSGGAVSAALVTYLEAHQGSAKYLVAASGSMTTAPIIIQTGKAVVTIGGFNGSDPAPTVAQLEQMVATGELKYVLLGGGGPGRGGDSSSGPDLGAAARHGRPRREHRRGDALPGRRVTASPSRAITDSERRSRGNARGSSGTSSRTANL
jgi:4-amino-4-deoxy-L-arabinose transferase-like glycosyltransferase